MALGSYSPFLLKPLGVPCLIYPAKGYSATIAIDGHRGAPTVSLTDLAWKIVFTRLGDRLRVAGTAELSGYSKDLNLVRCEALVKRTFELFPDAGDRESAQFWTGLRPATPSNVPLVGAHPLPQPVPRHRPRHAGLDDGLRLRARAGRRHGRPQAWRGFCIYRVADDACCHAVTLQSHCDRWKAFGLPSRAERADRRAPSIALVIVRCGIRSPTFTAMGGETLLRLLIGVDVVLGPLITLIIFDPAKPRAQVRPRDDRRAAAGRAGLRRLRDVRGAAGLHRVRRRTASRPCRRTASTTIRSRARRPSSADCRSPGRASSAAKPPADPEESVQDRDGRDGRRPRPRRSSALVHAVRRGRAGGRARRASAGRTRRARARTRPRPSARSSPTHGSGARSLGFVPVRARNKDFAAVVDRRTGEIVGYLAVNPW